MFYYQFWQLFELLPGQTIAHLLLWQCTDLTFELIFTESRWIHFSHEKKTTFHCPIQRRCPGSVHLALMWPVSLNKSKWEFLSSSQAIETAGSFYCLRKLPLHIDSALPEISPDAFRFPHAFCRASQCLSFVNSLTFTHSSHYYGWIIRLFPNIPGPLAFY